MQETQEIWIQSLGQEDPLEKEITTNSSVLAWEILWTKKPGRLQSMRVTRIGHDLATKPSLSPYPRFLHNLQYHIHRFNQPGIR